jgi:hypothetical protein
MTGRGWVDGSGIKSKPLMDEATRDEFDRIFRHGKYAKPTEEYGTEEEQAKREDKLREIFGT